MVLTITSNLNVGPVEERCCKIKKMWLDNQTSLGRIRKVAIERTLDQKMVPPVQQRCQLPSSSGIICVPDLRNIWLKTTEGMYKWSNSKGIHSHGEWVSLCGTLCGEYFTLPSNKKSNWYSIGVSQNGRKGKVQNRAIDLIKGIACVNKKDCISVIGLNNGPHRMNSSL